MKKNLNFCFLYLFILFYPCSWHGGTHLYQEKYIIKEKRIYIRMWRQVWIMQPFKWKIHDRNVSHSWLCRLKKVQTKIVGSALGHRQIELPPERQNICKVTASITSAAAPKHTSHCGRECIVWGSKSHDLEELPSICPCSCLLPLQPCSLAWLCHPSVRSVNLNFIYTSKPVLPV